MNRVLIFASFVFLMSATSVSARWTDESLAKGNCLYGRDGTDEILAQSADDVVKEFDCRFFNGPEDQELTHDGTRVLLLHCKPRTAIPGYPHKFIRYCTPATWERIANIQDQALRNTMIDIMKDLPEDENGNVIVDFSRVRPRR